MPSKDPKQQQLRQHKRNWNAGYRSISQKLKAFKNGINGKGDPKLNIAPSKIQDPLPSELVGLLSQLTSEFQQLVGDAGTIISEQGGYSNTRRKKAPKPKVIIPPGGAPPDNAIEQLTQRLGEYQFEIEKLSSSRLSRGRQYLTSVFSRDPGTKKRTSLLRQAADVFYAALDFENDVLTLNIKSISDAISRYETMRYNFLVIQRSIEDFQRQEGQQQLEHPQSAPRQNRQAIPSEYDQMLREQMTRGEEQPEETPQPGADTLIAMISNDLRIADRYNIASKFVRGIRNLIGHYSTMNSSPEREKLLARIMERHNKLLVDVFTQAKERFGVDVRSMQEFADLENEARTGKNANTTYSIEKYARNPITRKLKRWLVNLAPFNKTAAIRLEVVRLVDSVKKELQELMDKLEKSLDKEFIVKKVELIADAIDRMGRPMKILSIYYKEAYIAQERERAPHKGRQIEPHFDPVLAPILRRKVRQDFREGLF